MRPLHKAVSATASILLCIMVILTSIDVVGRYFFLTPLLGAHEMITLAMGIMIFLGMPLVTASREHLTVDLASSLLNKKGKRIQQIFVDSISAFTFLLFSWLLIYHGFGLSEDLMTTEDLEIEQAPISFTMAAMCFLTIFIFLYQAACGNDEKASSYKGKMGCKL